MSAELPTPKEHLSLTRLRQRIERDPVTHAETTEFYWFDEVICRPDSAYTDEDRARFDALALEQEPTMADEIERAKYTASLVCRLLAIDPTDLTPEQHATMIGAIAGQAHFSRLQGIIDHEKAQRQGGQL